jgi:SAM-dependent methyltransferase
MRLFVNGREVANSNAQKGPVVYAPAPFVIGAYRDKDENYPFSGLIAEATLWSRALPGAQIAERFSAYSKVRNPERNILPQPLVGPWVKFTAHDTATVYWESEEKEKGAVVFGETTAFGSRGTETEPSMNHSVELRGLKPKTKYFYQLRFPTADGGDIGGETYSLETDFNFIRPPQPDVKPFAEVDDKAVKIADWWKGDAQFWVSGFGSEPRGYILDYGCGDGQLVWELAKAMPGVSVIGVSDDAVAIAKARQKLDAAGVYGNRVTLMQCDLKKLPFHADTFDWVISSDLLRKGKVPGPVEEALRVTKPHSAFPMEPAWSGSLERPKSSPYDELGLKHWQKWWSAFDDRVQGYGDKDVSENVVLNILRGIRPYEGYSYWKIAPKGAGAWSHAYGDASNTANSGDSIVADGEVGLRWFGEPGARGMMDRQPRNAPPLCVNGTFYIQGNNRIFGLDAYNGAVRWSVELPNFRRVNVPHDSSNMCADTRGLYVAVKDRVWHLSDADGRLDHTLKVPTGDRDWGWLACHQDSPDTGTTVFGSTIKPGSTYTEFEGGEAFWYDTHTEASTAKVLSDSVFAHGLWTDKSAGVIINSTLCLGGERIYFVENPTFPFSSGRAETLDLYKGAQLVALDAKTGKRLWNKPLPLGDLGIAEALYLSYSDDKLVLLDSAGKAYHTFAFSAKDGKDLWKRTHPWKRDHHGGHLYHPVIVRGMVIVEPFGYDLASGEIRLSEMPERGGCSTLSAAKDALHFINWDYDKGSLYTWDLTTGSQRKFSGSRGNCFLSFISGSGMMLLPTASGGCSCRYPNQVSLGFGSK